LSGSSSSSSSSSSSGGGGSSGGGSSPTGGLLYSGGQDGCVRGWDVRQAQAVVNLKLHCSDSGVGALVDIVPCGASGATLVTAGADNRICVVDVRKWSR
jgi:WD40 repeat protein